MIGLGNVRVIWLGLGLDKQLHSYATWARDLVVMNRFASSVFQVNSVGTVRQIVDVVDATMLLLLLL